MFREVFAGVIVGQEGCVISSVLYYFTKEAMLTMVTEQFHSSLRDAARSLLPVRPWRLVGKGTAGVTLSLSKGFRAGEAHCNTCLSTGYAYATLFCRHQHYDIKDKHHDVKKKHHDVPHEHHDIKKKHHDVSHEHHDIKKKHHDVSHEHHDIKEKHYNISHEHRADRQQAIIEKVLHDTCT